jgi:hypothetical protein
MIPANLYIAIMLGAGVIMFLYGVGTGEFRVILGSFLFLGPGAWVYYASRKRT